MWYSYPSILSNDRQFWGYSLRGLGEIRSLDVSIARGENTHISQTVRLTLVLVKMVVGIPAFPYWILDNSCLFFQFQIDWHKESWHHLFTFFLWILLLFLKAKANQFPAFRTQRKKKYLKETEKHPRKMKKESS